MKIPEGAILQRKQPVQKPRGESKPGICKEKQGSRDWESECMSERKSRRGQRILRVGVLVVVVVE